MIELGKYSGHGIHGGKGKHNSKNKFWIYCSSFFPIFLHDPCIATWTHMVNIMGHGSNCGYLGYCAGHHIHSGYGGSGAHNKHEPH